MQKQDKSFSEDDIRPKDLAEGQQIAIANDIKSLLSRRDEFVDVDCPACGANNTREKFEKNGFHYVDCGTCGSFYMSPRPTPSIIENFLENSENYKYWSKYIFPASSAVRKEKIFVPRVTRTIGLCKKYNVGTESLLEVGAGYGFFCEEMNERHFFKRVVGVEPSPSWAKVCKEKGIEIIESVIENIDSDKTGTFDVLVNFEVVEHLFSPREFIIACRKILKPGGIFISSCPNGMGFDVETLGVVSDTIDHEHLNYFNPGSLSRLLADSGFEVLESITPGKLDADIVRNKILEGQFDISDQPFLKRVLIDEWERLGEPFQEFVFSNGLSSNMWLVAINRS